jgi:hypothetical protein
VVITQITDHVQQALNRLLYQYKGKANIAALLTALVEPIQELEDAIFDVNSGRQFFNGSAYPASGAQLDGIGAIVGVARNGLEDAEYLVFIIGTIVVNNSDGTIPTLLNVVNIFFEPDLFLAFDMYPAEFNVELAGSTLDPTLYDTAARFIQQALGASIGLGFIATMDETNAFRCCRLTGDPAIVRFSAAPAAGAFSLLFGTKSTGSLPFTANAAAVQAAITPLHGLSNVTVSGSFAAGLTINWGVGAQVPITVEANTLGVSIEVVDSVVITPGTGGGCADPLVPGSGGELASTVYVNQGV